MKKSLYFGMFLVLLTTLGCGKKVHISAPADGQVYNLQNNQFQYLDVTLDDNDYSNTTISFRGDLPNEVQCQSNPGGPSRCSYVVNAASGGTQTCSQSCTITIVANRNDVIDVRTIKFSRTATGK